MIPIHPALVHFPIAFYLLETFLLSLLVFKKREAYRDFAYLVFKCGYFMMWFALGSGLYSVGGIEKALQEAKNHFLFAVTVMVFSTIRFLLWRSSFSKNPNSLLISGLILSILTAVTAYFGGELVYS